jgi:D-tyrosyl-tRNA(Tyr) deacylase
MRAVIQRVAKAGVTINGKTKSAIGKGLLILLGIEEADGQEDVEWLSNKVLQLRIFDDENGVMNLSVQDIDGDCLLVSQFTLHAKTKKGNRPSYIKAAGPDIAIPLYEQFIDRLEALTHKKVGSGEFGAKMEISLVNSGPVTIIIDSRNKE